MKRGMHLTAALLLLALAVPAFAAGPEYDLGAIMGQYQTAAQDFGTVIKTAAVRLAGLLFLIDLVWMVLPRLLKGPDAQELLTAVIMRLMWYCLVLWIINTPSVPLAFVNGFIQLGKDGSHLTAISPSDVFWQGIDLVNNMSSAFEKTSSALDIYPSMLLLGVEFIVVIVFAFMAGQYAVTWIQFWFFMAMYPIVMAFGVTKFTKDMAMKIITTPIVYGVRFLALYFVLSVAVKVAGFIGNDLSTMTMTNLAPLWSVAGGSIVLLLAAIKAPQMATDLLNGTSSLSAADGLGAGLAAGGAIGMVAGGAVSAATSMAGGVQSAVGKAAGAFGAAAGGAAGGGAPGAGAGLGVPGLSGAGAS
ncbi:type IV secretion system protein, partial [Duganella callida]